jgi:hypothetical protein
MAGAADVLQRPGALLGEGSHPQQEQLADPLDAFLSKGDGPRAQTNRLVGPFRGPYLVMRAPTASVTPPPIFFPPDAACCPAGLAVVVSLAGPSG